MQSHPLLAEEERQKLLAEAQQEEQPHEEKEKEPDPKDLRIEELEKEKLELIALNEKLDKRIDEVIQEQRAKVEEIRAQYT